MWICSLKRIDVEFQDSSLCNRFVIVPLRSVALASSSYRISHSKALYYFTLTSQSKRSKHKKFLPFSCSFFYIYFHKHIHDYFFFIWNHRKFVTAAAIATKSWNRTNNTEKKTLFISFTSFESCVYIFDIRFHCFTEQEYAFNFSLEF